MSKSIAPNAIPVSLAAYQVPQVELYFFDCLKITSTISDKSWQSGGHSSLLARLELKLYSKGPKVGRNYLMTSSSVKPDYLQDRKDFSAILWPLADSINRFPIQSK
jgi:hypothetical protein